MGRGSSGLGGGGEGPKRLEKKSKPPNYPIRNQAFYRFGDENFTVGVVTMQGKRYISSWPRFLLSSHFERGHGGCA
jgi:hypothetical protein